MGLFSKTKEGKVKVGDTLPDFKLQDQHGNWVEASQFIGKKALVVYFYPKDDTPGCTKEACSFRDSFEDFKDIGAEVIGISADDVESHLKFAKKHRLPFILLSDKGNHVRDEVFGVPKDMFGLLPGRVTYIINKEGVIVKVFSAMSGGNHHTEALEVLK
ncbi:MAG: peroxiredoxin [Cytophagales bacterium]|nr:peroxiredoxin [Cytophagales bacterium]